MRVKVFRRNDAAGAVAHDLENHVNAWLAENSGKVRITEISQRAGKTYAQVMIVYYPIGG